jgi:TRAP-type C4-dicarboxylate transport system substrate-binding protein
MRKVRKFTIAVLIGIFLLVLAACGSSATATPAESVTATQPPADDGKPGETELTSSGFSFNFQYACINRTLNPCELLAAPGGMMDRIRERTSGQVDIQISSFPELGLGGPDTLRLIEDGTLGMAEIYSGYVGGDYPSIDAANLWGLIPDNEVNLKIIDAVAAPVKADLLDKFGAVVIGESYYPNNYYYSGRPLRTVADFDGMKTRSHSTVLADLINGMGADAQFMAFSEVYTGLERGILDAAVTCGVCGAGLRWFEVTDYLVGPIVALGVTYISVNKGRWDEIPTDMQNIILEEGIKHQAVNRSLVTVDWVKEGVDENVAGGMEYIEFTDEIKTALRKAAMEQVVPNWVERVGGPDTDAVKMYNEYVAPLLGVSIDSNGQAVEN